MQNPWSTKTIYTTYKTYNWNARSAQIRLELDHKRAYATAVKYGQVYFRSVAQKASVMRFEPGTPLS